MLALVTYLLGIGSGYLVWERDLAGFKARAETTAGHPHQVEVAGLVSQIHPHDGYSLPARYGDTGPQLLASGAIDRHSFVKVFEQSGQPLSTEQLAILDKGSAEIIVINRDNSRFLLNFFWALGLVNQNPLLQEGPMIEYSGGQVERYASTGGWTIGAKEAKELYASAEIVKLTSVQQEWVEEVATSVYRPCCNNPTHFPDCNHGMAMLGLLQLLASQQATIEEMFTAAKYVNAFWFPQQNLELAMFFKVAQGVDYEDVEAKQLVGPNFSSSSGSQAVRQWLGEAGLLQPTPSEGGGCGV